MSEQIDIRAKVCKSAYEASFFDMIDKKATYNAGKDKMEYYQKNRKKGDKRVTPYTYDLFHAIIRSVAPTMEDMKKNQKELYAECRANGTYFCFTTTKSLQTMMNDTKHHSALTPDNKTVYNQIKLLLSIGVLTDKENYVQTGHRNPFPCEKKTLGRSSGRGKIQLWISPEVLCIKDKYEGSAATDTTSFFGDIEKSLLQYRTSSLPYKDKVLKLITNTPDDVDKKALPVGKLKTQDIQGKGRENKQKRATMQEIPPEKLTKKQFHCLKLWNSLRFHLYQNRSFNEQTNIDCQVLLGDLLAQAEKEVQNYRKVKIRSLEQNPAYLAAKNQDRMLKNFASRLPKVDRAAFEIVSHAIVKQAKHAKKNAYQVWYPVNYLTSKLAKTYLGYSMDDWNRIQERFFDKNAASKAYFEQIQWINEQESAMVEELRTLRGLKGTYELTKRNYWRWYQALKQNPYLEASKQEELNQLFIQKFKPLLNDEYLNRQYENEA